MSMLHLLLPLAALLSFISEAVRVDTNVDLDSVLIEGEEGEGEVEVSDPVTKHVKKMLMRACVNAKSQRQALVAEPFLPEERGSGNITEGLDALWQAQDARRSSKRRKAIRQAKKAVADLGFNVKGASKSCRQQENEPLELLVVDCVADMASLGKTRVRGWEDKMYRRGGKEVFLNATSKRSTSLVQLVQRHYQVSLDITSLMRLSTRAFQRQPDVKAALKALKLDLQDADYLIKSTGFSVKDTEAYCERLHKSETPALEELLLKRVTKELTDAAAKVDGECREIEGKICPEATSPMQVRQYSSDRAAVVTAVAAVLWGPLGSAAGAGLGFLLGGVVGALQGMALMAVPGPVLVGAPLVGAIVGLPFKAECRCNLNACIYDEAMDTCRMETSNLTSNRFQWLPYPGTKCAEVTARKTKTCAMLPCQTQDFKPFLAKLEGTELYGTLGAVRQGGTANVKNCVSTDGTLHGSMLLATSKEVEVSVRQQAYEVLHPSAPGSV